MLRNLKRAMAQLPRFKKTEDYFLYERMDFEILKKLQCMQTLKYPTQSQLGQEMCFLRDNERLIGAFQRPLKDRPIVNDLQHHKALYQDAV